MFKINIFSISFNKTFKRPKEARKQVHTSIHTPVYFVCASVLVQVCRLVYIIAEDCFWYNTSSSV